MQSIIPHGKVRKLIWLTISIFIWPRNCLSNFDNGGLWNQWHVNGVWMWMAMWKHLYQAHHMTFSWQAIYGVQHGSKHMMLFNVCRVQSARFLHIKAWTLIPSKFENDEDIGSSCFPLMLQLMKALRGRNVLTRIFSGIGTRLEMAPIFILRAAKNIP